MRSKNIRLVMVSVLVSVFWFFSSMVTGAPAETPKDFTAWMLSLNEETREQVEMIFDQHMGCLRNGEDGSVPDYNEAINRIHSDLQFILTPGQYKAFTETWNRKRPGDKANTELAACESCCSALIKLNQAYGYIILAIDNYKPDIYCDFGFNPDNVGPCMNSAKYRIDRACQYAAKACNTCNCYYAKRALYYAESALPFIECAIFNADRYCPNAPSYWRNKLESTKIWLIPAISKLKACVQEACN